ncbi:MAG: 3'-5' exonuclease [Pirellulaceae bacterium]|nr:3'-5' exonuclease [Pirellulaceae bacterium]
MFFDTETSGLPRQMDAPVARLDNWPRVVQLAWILTDFAGRVISERQFLIQPGQWRMQPGALRVHGITISHARRHGQPLAEVLNRFALDLLQTDSVIGHNVQFDQKILGAEFLRVGQTNPLQKRHAQCTMKMGASFLQRHYPEFLLVNRSGAERITPPTSPSCNVDYSAGVILEVAASVETVAESTAAYRVDPSSKPIHTHGRMPSPAVEPVTPAEGATWRDSNTGFRYPSLRRLHRTLFGNDFDNAHNALADTQACMNCFFRMCRG